MLSKLLKVKDLPHGYFKEQLTALVEDPKVAEVIVVAKEVNSGEWAAYIGWPTLEELKPDFRLSENYRYYCTRVHYAGDVAARGDKLSRGEAEAVFPNNAFPYHRYRS